MFAEANRCKFFLHRFASVPSEKLAKISIVGYEQQIFRDNEYATQVTEWEEWTIPLQEFADLGVDLTNVNSITIGFGTQGDTTMAGGFGKILFDDIRIYNRAVSP